ncbi:hypothetical protein SDC9_205884 [bioreactor metagenome]|uniref:Uncharacterized protein n=1 Tax=bioreactor metagenome TaxID=1076179 RepID=A0A645JF01_9ZZZZ
MKGFNVNMTVALECAGDRRRNNGPALLGQKKLLHNDHIVGVYARNAVFAKPVAVPLAEFAVPVQ